MPGLLDVLWVARYDYAPGCKLALHRHRFYQAIAVVSGAAEAHANAATFPLHPAVFWFIPPGTTHGMIASSAHGLKTLDVKFQVRNRELASMLKMIKTVQPRPDAAMQLECIRQEGLQRDLGFREQCAAILQQLLIQVARSRCDLSASTALTPNRRLNPSQRETAKISPPHRHADPVIANLLHVYDLHLSEALTAREIARRTGYSYTHLLTHCREAFALTPIELLFHTRIERACQLLLYSDWEVKHVADQTGFRSVHHFTRRFTQIMGESPALWRTQRSEGVCQDIYITDGFANRNRIVSLSAPESVISDKSTSLRAKDIPSRLA